MHWCSAPVYKISRHATEQGQHTQLGLPAVRHASVLVGIVLACNHTGAGALVKACSDETYNVNV